MHQVRSVATAEAPRVETETKGAPVRCADAALGGLIEAHAAATSLSPFALARIGAERGSADCAAEPNEGARRRS